MRPTAIEMATRCPPGTKVKVHWYDEGRLRQRTHGVIVGYEQINCLGYITLTPIIRVRDGLMAGYECWWTPSENLRAADAKRRPPATLLRGGLGRTRRCVDGRGFHRAPGVRFRDAVYSKEVTVGVVTRTAYRVLRCA